MNLKEGEEVISISTVTVSDVDQYRNHDGEISRLDYKNERVGRIVETNLRTFTIPADFDDQPKIREIPVLDVRFFCGPPRENLLEANPDRQCQ